jgi:hypothetical protein
MFVEHPQATSCCCLKDMYIHWFAGDEQGPTTMTVLGKL